MYICISVFTYTFINKLILKQLGRFYFSLRDIDLIAS